MARKPRIEFPNALYHIFARGNRRLRIFLKPEDYQEYLKLLFQYKNRDGFQLYAYALMSNHLHLLIETGPIALSKTMQGLQQSYTQYFNREYRQVGHLFQGRYKAILCQKDTYLLELIRYIHLNPIRANVAKNLTEYPWTSHGNYIRTDNRRLIDTDFVLQIFDNDKKKARTYYHEYIRDGLKIEDELFVKGTIDTRILGEEDFVQSILKKGNSEIGAEDEQDKTNKIGLNAILKTICKYKNIPLAMIKTKTKIREIVFTRRLFCYLTRAYFGYSLKEIGAFLRLDITTVSNSVKVIRFCAKHEPDLDTEIKNLLKSLKWKA